MEQIKTVGYTNKKTGELFDVNEIVVIKDVVEVKKTYKSIKGTNNFINDNLGYYFHLLYGDILKLNLEPQMLIRFLKLCSYSNYNNILVNGNTSGQASVYEKELPDILKLKARETINTKNYLLENNLISIENDTIKVNDKYSIRGKVKGDLKNMEITRIFNNGFQELYDSVKPVQHKKLATFIKILPYINLKYNIICENPLETDIEKVKPITWTKLGREIGLSEATAKRLRSELWNLKINNTATIGEFSTFLCGKSIVINPGVYYKGNDIDSLRGIINLFKVKSK